MKWHKTHYVATALAVVLGLFGCPKAPPPPPPVLDAGPVDAGPPPDAGPLPIAGLRLVGLVDAGPAVTTGEDAGADAGPLAAPTTLDLTLPDASIPDDVALAFEAAVPLEDARFRLLTESDHLVPSHEEIWITDGGTRVVMAPAPYWPAQGCCRFAVDGDDESFPTGGGHRYRKFEASFGVAADPGRLKAAAAAAAKSRRRHHHRR